MANLGGVFDACTSSFLPGRLRLHEEGFAAAFKAHQGFEAEAGRRVTLDSLCANVGIDGRVLRRARAGDRTLPRHQVMALADRFGCPVGAIVHHPNEAEEAAWAERSRGERVAWPVPLAEVTSWTGFVRTLRRAEEVRTSWRDDAVDLCTAPAIDAFAAALGYARRVAAEHPAMAAAALMDARDALDPLGLHVLVGRFMGRRDTSVGDWARVSLMRVLVIQIRRETSDPDHAVDRTGEPSVLSEEEESDQCVDDPSWADPWLAWEGKPRLSLWRSEG